ncbi:MAG: S8 family serine peptidase [Nitrospirota bacterium]|jgi:subtilisin family serine protease
MALLRLLVLVLLAIVIVYHDAEATGRRRGPQWIPGELIVGIKAGVTTASIDRERTDGTTVVATLPRSQLRLVRVPVDRLPEVELALAADPTVAFVERNRLLPPAEMPNDPVTSYHTALVGLPTAWDTTHGSANLVIAILDSGISPSHPDLAGKLVPGYNFWDDNDDTADVFGHGTEVAGIAAAVTDNDAGVAGAAWSCGLMPLRVTNRDGFASLFAILQAFTWAMDNGAQIVNLSFEGIHSSPALDSGLAYVRAQGGLTVAAGGNGGLLDPSPDHPDVLSVSATNADDERPSWASFGPYIDLAAPGVSVKTTRNGGGTVTVSGTSFSSPLVAGIAALVWSVDPGLTPAQVEALLKETAVDLGATGWDDRFGAGRVDAAAAVGAARAGHPSDTTPPTVEIVSPAEGDVVAGATTITAHATDASGIARIEFRVDAEGVATDLAPPYQYLWDTTSVANGNHTVAAIAVDNLGNQSSAGPLAVTVDNPVPPSLTGLSVTAAQPKTPLTLLGAGFDVTTVRVTIGNKYAPIITASPTTVTVKVPRLTKYTVVPVVIANGTAESAPLPLEIR